MAKEFKYRDVLKDKEYRKLLFSNLINRFGDSIDAIAFTWLTYQITHSAAWAAMIYGLNVLPNIIIQPLAGPVVEKMDKKKVIVFTHLARALVIAGFMLMYITGFVNPYIMAAFTLLITTIESVNLPAAGAFTPLVVKKENLAHAMSLSSSLASAIQLVGTGIAGVIIAALGVQTAMIIDILTFFIAAFGVMSVKTLDETVKLEKKLGTSEPETGVKESTEQESYFEMLKAGVKYVASNRVIVNYGIMAIFMNFLLVPLNSLQAPIADEIFGLGSGLLSVIGMAASLGGIVGSVITPMIIDKVSAKKVVVSCGIIMGIFLYALSLGRFFYGNIILGYAFAGVCIFLMAFVASLMGGLVSIQFVKVCDKNYLARAGAVMGATGAASTPVGAFLVSVLSAQLSPAILIAGCGIMAVLFMIIAGISNMDFELIKKEEIKNAVEALG